MQTQRTIYLLIFGLLLPLFSPAQIIREEGQAGYWTFDLNGGFSFQSSDIPATDQGFGFGITLGKNLYYQPGAAFSFDLRGRLLFARQYGLDPFRSFDIERNEALNGDRLLDYTTYPAQLNIEQGFVFQNHRTDVFELGLEGVLTFNRLRERTGLVFSLFGGAGVDWYLVKTDQADASGNPYYEDYASLNENAGKSNVRNELRRAILDRNYETLADDFTESGKLGLMPSVGLEVGYDLSRTFSIFAGHRLTFAGTDLLDGHQWKQSNNDIYHYTHFGLRWKIYPRQAREMVSIPEIDITRPYADPYRTQDPREGFVRADIRHVRSQSDVTCRLNGRDIPFNYSYGTLEAEFLLQAGRNEVQIMARNGAGSASKSVVIILEEDAPPPATDPGPSIVITDPPYPEYVVREDYFPVQAVIEEVFSRDGVEFYLNGEPYGFDYNITNGRFSADVPLRVGRNEIRIIARNAGGQREQISSLIREAAPQPPGVRFLQPAVEYSETQETAFLVVAGVEGVERRDQITLYNNGQPVTNFNFDPGAGRIEANLPLQPGNNTLEVFVRTDGGEASDRVSIVRRTTQPQTPPPLVDIQSPGQSQVSTFNPSGEILARVENVRSRADITVEINGQRTGNFSFSNGLLRVNIPLQMGENRIRITAYNESGTASDDVYILRDREVIPANPPTVYILTPRDREETFRSQIDLRAETRNVRSKNDIAMDVNGRRIYGFSFNTLNGEIRANLPLEPGLNQIRIQVRNPDGADGAAVSVNYRQPLPPTVRIVSPANGLRTQAAETRVQAIAQHVNRISQIGFLVNGQRISRFDFSGARGEIVADIRLQPGRNTIRILAENADGRAEDAIEVFSEQTPAPVVRIARPVNNTRTTEPQVRLEASVQHVRSQNDIEVTLNGRGINSFAYNNVNGSLTADVRLQTGNNTIQIRAVNATGSDAAAVSVNYAPPSPPAVTITDPSDTNTQSAESTYTVRARTTQVTQRSDITLTVNGQINDRFTWNAGTGELSLNLTLAEGENRVRIQARNTAGQAEAATTIVYQAPQPPEVVIETPVNDEQVREDRVTVRARLANVESKRNIILKVNGRYRTDFAWDGEVLTIELTGLTEGKNQISISATNRYGRDFEERTVIYEPVRVAPPVVRITSVSNPVIDFNNPQYGLVSVVARIENVENAGQITLSLNGESSTKFTFNSGQQNFEANLLLKKGVANTILIEAKNEAGTGRDSREVKF